MENVTLPLKEYNQLYEQAFFNQKKAELEKERRVLEEEKQLQADALKQKEKRLDESKARGERERRGAVTSQNWLLSQQQVEGCYEAGDAQDSGSAVFNFTIELRVFEPEWTIIPVVDSQMITDSWTVQRASESLLAPQFGGGEPAWAPVSLGSDTMLLVQELDGMPGRQVLATSIPGLYRITFNVYAFVHSARNLNALSLNLLHPITAARLQLKHGADTRTRVRELNITPAARYSVEEKDGSFDISMKLPATKTIEVKWRGVETGDAEWERMNPDGVAEKAAVEEPLQVTATHDALHSIMDGVLQSNHALKFCVDSEQRALTGVRFTVHGPARVTSVTGHGVMSWRASPVTSDDSGAEPATLVEVSFKTSLISDTIIVLLNTELELGVDGFMIPALVCEGVLRQSGSLAVVKLANVEVHEQQTKGMARVGVDELPLELTSQTNRPIMFAYKYLSPQCKIQLRVIKHEQVNVLEAVADTAFYEVLVSEGQSMHRLMLNMQNSRKQYLEVSGIPADARIWSLIVNSKPAKPVRGEDGNLLIPLLVGVSGNSNVGAQTTSVELVYLRRRDPLGDTGVAQLAPPRLDIPISTLLMEVQWPESHEVKFRCAAKAVQGFSHSLPKPVNHDVGTDMVASGFNFNNAPAHIPKAGVNVQVPRAGQRHRFEQLLVVDGGATLDAEYHALIVEEDTPKSWLAFLLERMCARRR